MPKKQKPKKSGTEITKDKLQAIIKRLVSGESALIAESKRLGFSDNSPLRMALRELLGGKTQYRAMIAKGMHARKKSRTKPPERKTGKKKPPPTQPPKADAPQA